MAHILIVDDEKKIRDILRIMLTLKGHIIDEAENGIKALEKIEQNAYDLVIADIKMPKLNGIDLLKKLNDSEYPIPVIFITAYGSIDSAVEAMRLGAIDYIAKPFEEERIMLAIERSLGISKLLSEKKALQKELEDRTLPKDIICESPHMKKVIENVKKVAMLKDTTVIVTGESGVGKEVIARYLHSISERKNHRFIAINCAAIPSELIESELFGHEKGAFTGASQRKKGIFEAANGGTVFLDEVGDLPLDAQAKMLRVLQERKVQRIGGVEEIPVDVRVIAATNKDLEKLVQEKKFREDLYYRLHVFPVHIPPLRERKQDILPLVDHFIRQIMGKTSKPFITAGAKKILESYPFPGNVRELRNAVERAIILAGSALPLTAEHFSFLTPKPSAKKIFELPPEGISLEALEKELIKQALERTSGNKSAAARILGLTRSKFRTRLKLLEEKSEKD